jgi:hypothetical protein
MAFMPFLNEKNVPGFYALQPGKLGDILHLPNQ